MMISGARFHIRIHFFIISLTFQFLIWEFQTQVIGLKFRQLESTMKTPGQSLRESFMDSPITAENHHDDSYLSQLQDMGVKPLPCIFPAYFSLKNGLKYPGMATSRLIESQEVLLRVPESLILSSAKAAQELELSEVFSQPFYHSQFVWEDRVLLTYCLYLIDVKAEENIFYKMICHMSKEIDLGYFWPQEDLAKIKDPLVVEAIKYENSCFEREWEQFSTVKSKHKILQGATFTKSNYQWIYTHISSRCFANKIDHTSFVPYCEFFNHHSSSVYYKTNSNKTTETDIADNTSQVSSSGTYESKGYEEEGEFDYDKFEFPETDQLAQQASVDSTEKNKITDYVNNILARTESQISWKDFSVLFVGHFFERVKHVEREYLSGHFAFETSLGHLKSLQKILDKYSLLVKAFYQSKFGKQFKYKVENNEKIEEKGGFQRPDFEHYKPTYTEFTLQSSKKDIFNPSHQVYFRYGKKCNRELLLRYGFTIEGNKYDYSLLSFDLDINLEFMPHLFQRMKILGLSLRRKFKVNHTRLNLDLIIFHRLNSWNLYSLDSLNEIFFVMNLEQEIEILNQVQESLEAKLEHFDGEEYDLTDKSLTYHQYFISTFHLEQVRILRKQISLFQKLKLILKELLSGASREESEEKIFTSSEKFMVKEYLDSVCI